MGNRFVVMLVALGVAFCSGWLFGNEVTPPRMEDVNVAMWIACGVVSVLSAMTVGGSR